MTTTTEQPAGTAGVASQEQPGHLVIFRPDGHHAYGEVWINPQADGSYLVRPVTDGPQAWKDTARLQQVEP